MKLWLVLGPLLLLGCSLKTAPNGDAEDGGLSAKNWPSLWKAEPYVLRRDAGIAPDASGPAAGGGRAEPPPATDPRAQAGRAGDAPNDPKVPQPPAAGANGMQPMAAGAGDMPGSPNSPGYVGPDSSTVSGEAKSPESGASSAPDASAAGAAAPDHPGSTDTPDAPSAGAPGDGSHMEPEGSEDEPSGSNGEPAAPAPNSGVDGADFVVTFTNALLTEILNLVLSILDLSFGRVHPAEIVSLINAIFGVVAVPVDELTGSDLGKVLDDLNKTQACSRPDSPQCDELCALLASDCSVCQRDLECIEATRRLCERKGVQVCH